MKTRILCFLMLLIATSSLCTVNAQSYYWEENTTPFTMHYILDISSNYNGIPPEIKCLGGSFGTIGTAKFYKDKVILNDKIVFDLPDHKSNGNKRFISKYTYNLNSKEQVNYMLSFRPSNGKTSLREPDPYLVVIYFEKGGNNFSREEPEYIRIRLLTETAFRALENKARSDNATNVPVNTYSGGYENNNTNTRTNDNNTEKENKALKNALEYYERYGDIDCHLCKGTGTCKTCNGQGWFYSSFGTGKITCPNCCSEHVGKCGKCCGTGKVHGKKY